MTSAVPPSATQRHPLDTLFERGTPDSRHVRGSHMPAELERRYGGNLLVPVYDHRPTVLANFVSTLDGIVALGGGDLSGGGVISGFHEPDRFVMGLLRSVADVVVVGAGTLRGSSEHRWTPRHIHPDSAAAFAAWRTAMGLAPQPTTIVVTGSGQLPVTHPALRDPDAPVVIVTTANGARHLRSTGVDDRVAVHSVDGGTPLGAQDVVAVARRLGAQVVLTEGGPHLLGEFIKADLLDELFLTLAPQFVGRGDANRLGLVEGLALAPSDARWQELLSVRRSQDHLFLRYSRRHDSSTGGRSQ